MFGVMLLLCYEEIFNDGDRIPYGDEVPVLTKENMLIYMKAHNPPLPRPFGLLDKVWKYMCVYIGMKFEVDDHHLWKRRLKLNDNSTKNPRRD